MRDIIHMREIDFGYPTPGYEQDLDVKTSDGAEGITDQDLI